MMSRIRMAAVSAWLGIATASPTFAGEVEWTFTNAVGHSTNIFDSPEHKADHYVLADAQLRGSIGHDQQKVAFALKVSQKSFASYTFGNRRSIESEVAYRTTAQENIVLTLEAAFGWEDGGDLFASIGGIDIGYRAEKTRLGFGGSLAFTDDGARTTTLSTSYRSLEHGEAHFNLPGLLPARLEPQYAEYVAAARHDVAAGDHIISAKASWHQSLIPDEDRDLYVRYPARVAAVSALWSGGLGTDASGFRFQLEAGSAFLSLGELGPDEGWYPFYSAEGKWTLGERASISAGIGRSLMVAEIDDAVAEDVTRGVLRLAGRLTDSVEAELTWEQSSSHQIYFDYPTRTTSWSGGFSWALTSGISARFSYTHERHEEFDPAFGYTNREMTASIAARF